MEERPLQKILSYFLPHLYILYLQILFLSLIFQIPF
nr:MAG TPA: hypothetical protein [Caudoviricetes sp.]